MARTMEIPGDAREEKGSRAAVPLRAEGDIHGGSVLLTNAAAAAVLEVEDGLQMRRIRIAAGARRSAAESTANSAHANALDVVAHAIAESIGSNAERRRSKTAKEADGRTLP